LIEDAYNCEEEDLNVVTLALRRLVDYYEIKYMNNLPIDYKPIIVVYGQDALGIISMIYEDE